jgi:1-acyl-sn-glycerol-3-phosphate acyltransferase
MLYQSARFLGRILAKGYFRLQVKGAEHVPAEEGCIVVANHTSFLDPLLICIAAPRPVHYLTYAYYFYLPHLHWFCKRVYCIPLKKDGKDIGALKTALRQLKQHELLGLFPEGRRSETGQLGQPEPGVALIALKANVPLLPVGIRGAYEAFPKGAKFPRPHPITLTFGPPFRLEDELGAAQSHKAVQKRALQLIMSKIAAACAGE